MRWPSGSPDLGRRDLWSREVTGPGVGTLGPAWDGFLTVVAGLTARLPVHDSWFPSLDLGFEIGGVRVDSELLSWLDMDGTRIWLQGEHDSCSIPPEGRVAVVHNATTSPGFTSGVLILDAGGDVYRSDTAVSVRGLSEVLSDLGAAHLPFSDVGEHLPMWWCLAGGIVLGLCAAVARVCLGLCSRCYRSIGDALRVVDLTRNAFYRMGRRVHRFKRPRPRRTRGGHVAARCLPLCDPWCGCLGD